MYSSVYLKTFFYIGFNIGYMSINQVVRRWAN